MAIIKTINNKTPVLGKECFLAENSVVTGNVVLGDYCSVWFNAVIRGDVNAIVIGDRVNIQDGAIIHGSDESTPTRIGDGVTIGHNAIVHGCTVEDSVMIGMGAIVLDRAVVKSNSVVAAGAVVLENTVIESGSLYAGIPAKKTKEFNENDLGAELKKVADSYVKYSKIYEEVNPKA